LKLVVPRDCLRNGSSISNDGFMRITCLGALTSYIKECVRTTEMDFVHFRNLNTHQTMPSQKGAPSRAQQCVPLLVDDICQYHILIGMAHWESTFRQRNILFGVLLLIRFSVSSWIHYQLELAYHLFDYLNIHYSMLMTMRQDTLFLALLYLWLVSR
jgi:hypothetical protein